MDFIVGGRGGTAEQTSFFMAVVFFQVCYFFSVFYCKVSSRFYGGHAFGADICSFDGYVSFGLHGEAAFGGNGGAYIPGGAVMAVVIPVPCDGRVFFDCGGFHGYVPSGFHGYIPCRGYFRRFCSDVSSRFH